jgi:hypothetical protein
MPLVILQHLLNVSVQLANKRGLKKIFQTAQNIISVSIVESSFFAVRFTEALPRNDKGKYSQIHRLLGMIYKVQRSDGLRRHNISIEFHKVLFRHSKVNKC